MSLFGGDSPPPGQLHSDTSFSISPISSREASPQVHAESRHDSQDQPYLRDDHGRSVSVQSEDEQLDNPADDRPRFVGSDQLWQYYVRDEISLAKSLQDLRANDLAAHLYNAYAWKKSLITSREQDGDALHAPNLPSRAGTGKTPKSWQPDALWTKWPLELEHVPPPGKNFWGWDVDYTFTRHPKSVSSRLRQELVGLALECVKHQWNAREIASLPPKESRSWPASSRRDTSATPETTSSCSSEEHLDPSADGHKITQESDLVLSADDRRSESLIGPSINHAITQLDALLLTLHYSRAGRYIVVEDDDVSRRQLRSLSASRSRSRSRSRSIGLQQRRRLSDNSSAQGRHTGSGGSPPDQSARSSPGEKSDTVSSHARGRRPRTSSTSSTGPGHSDNSDLRVEGPKGWTEVLDKAAFSGWDASALERARRRCEALFGEAATPPLMPKDTGVTSGTPPAPKQSGVNDEFDVIRCPVETCSSQGLRFQLSRLYRLREHLKRVHAYTSAQVAHAESSLNFSRRRNTTPVSNTRGWIPPDPLRCPHPECPRQDKIYPEARRLVEHLRRYHKYDPRTGSPPARDLPSDDIGATTAAGDDVVELPSYLADRGVHKDRPLRSITKGTP